MAFFSLTGPLALALASTTAVDPRFSPLISWLEGRGANLGPITLGKSGMGDGAGAFVSRDVPENELLFEIPVDACIGIYTACGDEAVGDAQVDGRLDVHCAVLVAVLERVF